MTDTLCAFCGTLPNSSTGGNCKTLEAAMGCSWNQAPSPTKPYRAPNLLETEHEAVLSQIGRAAVARKDAEIERLRAALESLTKDPPATLARDPDEDWEVIVKMRAIARAALDHGLPTAEDVRGILKGPAAQTPNR